jgi:hypothetical protein
MKTQDQMSYESINDYRNARLEDFRKTIGIDAAYKGARLRQIDRAQGMQNRHNIVMEGVAETRTQQGQERVNQGQTRVNLAYDRAHPKTVQTPRGAMILDPTGTRGKIGDQLWQKTGPGQWTRVK